MKTRISNSFVQFPFEIFLTVLSLSFCHFRAASRGNSPAVVMDNSRPYATLNADRRDDSNPQVFTNESFYTDISSQAYASLKYSSRRQSIHPPPYEDDAGYVNVE